MYGYGKRHIKVDENDLDDSVTGETVRIGEGNFPSVGVPILNLYKRLTGKSRSYLTPSQMERLTGDAYGFGAVKEPSAQSQYEDYPVEFTLFIENIPVNSNVYKTRIKSERISMGLLIDIVVHYHWKGGWLHYRPHHAPKNDGIDILELGLGHHDE